MAKAKFPNLVAELARKGECQKSLAVLLHLNQATISRKMNGISDWTIGEIETLCDYFNKDYYTLFK